MEKGIQSEGELEFNNEKDLYQQLPAKAILWKGSGNPEEIFQRAQGRSQHVPYLIRLV